MNLIALKKELLKKKGSTRAPLVVQSVVVILDVV